jgi:hypothetical protein
MVSMVKPDLKLDAPAVNALLHSDIRPWTEGPERLAAQANVTYAVS